MVDDDDPYDPNEALFELNSAIDAGDGDRIGVVAEKYVWVLTTHHYDRLLDAFETMPIRVLERHDVLKLVHPMAAAMSRANPQVVPGQSILDLESMTDRELDEYQFTQTISRRLNGDIHAATEIAARLDERLVSSKRPAAPRGAWPVPQYRFQIGLTYLLNGQIDRALSCFSTARQLAELDTENHVQRDASAKAAIAHAFRGSIEQAERELHRSRSLPLAPLFFAGSMETSEKIADSLIQVEKMSPIADSVVDALEPLDTPDELWPFVALARARLDLARSRPADALDSLTIAFDTHRWQAGTIADDIRIALTADAFLALGEPGAAGEICSEMTAAMQLSRLSDIRVMIHSGDLARAARSCRALSSARDVGTAVRMEAMTLLAWISVEIDGSVDESAARMIAQIADGAQHQRIFTTVPATLIDSVAAALPENLAIDFRSSVAGTRFGHELPSRPKFTPSEAKLLAVIGQYETTAQIANVLFLSPNTVKTQLASIYRKLGVNNRSDAVATATRMNLIPVV